MRRIIFLDYSAVLGIDHCTFVSAHILELRADPLPLKSNFSHIFRDLFSYKGPRQNVTALM